MGTKGYERKPGRLRKNWMDIVREDLKDMGTTWDEAEEQSRMASTGGQMHPSAHGMN